MSRDDDFREAIGEARSALGRAARALPKNPIDPAYGDPDHRRNNALYFTQLATKQVGFALDALDPPQAPSVDE